MTTRYSRREGAPLQGWAGGNEGCWATARPAAPPPPSARRSRKIHLLLPSCAPPPPLLLARTLARALLSPRLPTLASTRRYSPFHLDYTSDRRCISVLFFVIPLLTLAAPTPSSLPPCYALVFPIAFSYRILYFSCRPCSPRASSSRTSLPPRLPRRVTLAAIFTPCTIRSDIQADECAESVRLSAIASPMSLMRLPVFLTRRS